MRTRLVVIVVLSLAFVLPVSAGICILNMGNCPSGFVRLYPVSASVQAGSAPPQGYLRIEADSDTAAMASNERLQNLDRGLQYLSVTAQVSLASGSSPEYPLVLYDLVNRREVTVISYGLAHGEYVDLQSGFQPTIVVHVRAVPQTIGNAYLRAFQKVDDYLKNSPAKTLLAAAPQLALATNVLSSFADAAIADQNKEWESSKTIGLTAGVDAVLPLNGTPVILFLVPTTQYDAEKLRTASFTIDKHRVYRDGKPFDDVPYVILRALTTDYRPLTPDFVQNPIGCSSSAEDVADVDSLLQKGSLSSSQREYERQIVATCKILQVVRQPETAKSIDAMANSAFALMSLPDHSDEFWKAHYATTASALNNCIDQTFAAQVVAADKWSRVKQAIAESKAWRDKAVKSGDAKRKDSLEQSLKIVVMPIKTYQLSEGDAFDYLTNVRDDIEAELKPYYDQVAASARAASSAADRSVAITNINARITATDCASCKDVLKSALADVAAAANAADARAQLVDAQRRIAELQSELADKLGTAKTVAATAEQTSAGGAAATQLQQTVSASTQLLTVSHPTETDLRTAIERVDQTTSAVQAEFARAH